MRGKARLAALLLCAAMLAVPAAGAATRTGKVVRVVDGETVKVKVGKRTITVYLNGGCPEATRKLRSLLPRGARVKVRGSYVYRGSRQVNRSLRATCRALEADPAPGPAPAPTPAPLPQPAVTPAPAPGPVDSPANRAEFDKVLRGFKFVVHDSQSGGSFNYTQDRVFHWCADGTFVYERTLVSNAGNEYEREDGTWKVSNVTVRNGQNIEGNVDVNSGPQGQAPTQGFVYAGLTSDGTAFVRVEGTNGPNRLATRSADNFC